MTLVRTQGYFVTSTQCEELMNTFSMFLGAYSSKQRAAFMSIHTYFFKMMCISVFVHTVWFSWIDSCEKKCPDHTC